MWETCLAPGWPQLRSGSRAFLGWGGKHSFPSTSTGDLRELPMVPLIGEGCCGVGGASRRKEWDKTRRLNNNKKDALPFKGMFLRTWGLFVLPVNRQGTCIIHGYYRGHLFPT